VIAQWEQPASINYDSAYPFRLAIIESYTDWSFFPYTEKTYLLYVGDEELPYGWWWRFPFYYHKEDAEDRIKRSRVEWSESGVIFNAVSGETLFLPKSSFSRSNRFTP
jgi:hypothetical protein